MLLSDCGCPVDRMVTAACGLRVARPAKTTRLVADGDSSSTGGHGDWTGDQPTSTVAPRPRGELDEDEDTAAGGYPGPTAPPTALADGGPGNAAGPGRRVLPGRRLVLLRSAVPAGVSGAAIRAAKPTYWLVSRELLGRGA